MPDLSCQQCGQIFKRPDHLARHELSHEAAKHQCQVATCGMTFHRRDALKRHEHVHLHDPTKKRRRPRRGVIPRPRSIVASADAQLLEDTYPLHDDTNTGAIPSAEVLVPRLADVVALSRLTSLDFCFIHYVEMCGRRWPSIHHSWLHQPHITQEKRLAAAALGGCVVPEYRSVAATFFEDARRSLLERYGVSAASAIADLLQDPDSQHAPMLELLQTHMLLLEYALWLTDTDTTGRIKRWAMELTFEYASVIIPKLMDHVKDIQKSQHDWQQWVYEEQLVRALWTFYCVTQKAMGRLPCSVSTLRVQQYLRLPHSDSLFHALSEESWRKCHDESHITGVSTKDTTLKTALRLIQSSEPLERQVLTNLTLMARHVVLVALLELYTNGVKYVSWTTNDESSQTGFVDTICNARSLWPTAPGELLFSSTVRSSDFQNVLIMNYLHIHTLLRYASQRDAAQYWPDLCMAASIANEVLRPILENGAIDVATRAVWLTDAASKRYVVKMAQVMVDWATMLKTVGSGVICPDTEAHVALYRELRELLSQQGATRRSDDSQCGEFERFAVDLSDAWSDILRCPAVKWYHQQIFPTR